MTTERNQDADEYRSTLGELTNNNKTQINLLTILAEDYVHCAADITNVIETQIFQVPPAQKLAVLYVADSIVKNAKPETGYKELFSRRIVKTFVHVFSMADERARVSLYKLRQTWVDVFPKSKLYAIDIKVNGIDPAWPIVNPQASDTSPIPSSSHIHVNPKFLPQSKDQIDIAVTSDEERLEELRRKKEEMQEMERDKLKMQIAEKELLLQNSKNKRSNSKLDQTDEIRKKSKSPKKLVNGKVIEKERKSDKSRRSKKSLRKKTDESRHSPSSVPTTEISNIDSKIETEVKKRIRSTETQQEASESNNESQHIDVKRPRKDKSESESERDMEMEKEMMKEKEMEREMVKEKEKERERDKDKERATVKHQERRFSPNEGRSGRRWVGGRPPRPLMDQLVSFEPTATPGQHAFIVPPIIPPSAPQTVPDRSSNVRFTGLLPTPSLNFMPSSSFPSTVITTNDQDQPKLDIPANNRIFVDGKAYEVAFIDQVPVIERNGLPHRIYFTGPPRNVIIDGLAHSLAFGDKKTIVIDGQPHIVRFGAPSRELYMGDYPFRGAFGGPPIFATINGTRHEIRLGGPPPEVKIEPDPCWELLRHMTERHAVPRGPCFDYGSAPRPLTPATIPMQLPQIPTTRIVPVQQQQQTPQNQMDVDVGGLLYRLLEKGVLLNKTTSSPNDGNGRSPTRPPTPPIPSQHHFTENEAVERQSRPPATLKDFGMRAFKVRYQTVIDALYQTQQRCPNCGLRFDDLRGEKYQHHLDWHFKENLRVQDGSRGVSRQWYLVIEDWINFTEQGDDPASKAKSDVFEEIMGRPGESDLGSQLQIPTTAVCDLAGEQMCTMCNDKFEEYWDEEDDAWRFRNCVVHDGKPYHPVCYQDVSIAASHHEDQMLEPPSSSSDELTIPVPSEIVDISVVKHEIGDHDNDVWPQFSSPDDILIKPVKSGLVSSDSVPRLDFTNSRPRSPGTPVRDE